MHSSDDAEATTASDSPLGEERGHGPRPWWMLLVDLLRGFLIGLTELVPGVSGSTVAMILRAYTTLILSANHVVRSGRGLLRGRTAVFRKELSRVDFRFVLPLGVGMVAALFLLAGPIHDLVESYPLSALGLFFGIVVIGIAAPLQLVDWRGQLKPVHGILFLVGAVAAFLLTGLAADGSNDSPSYIVVFLAAAVAICALVIPGVSGSFLLLAMGLYSPTLLAVSELDLVYISVFGLGACVGLISIVQVLVAALGRAPHLTVAVMAGLMAGSLRALWPWAPGSGTYTSGEILGPIAFMGIGAVFVVITMLLTRRRRAGTAVTP